MILSNVTEAAVLSAADSLGFVVDMSRLSATGRRLRVKLNLRVPADARTPGGARKKGERGAVAYEGKRIRFDGTERRNHSVCWHGFRDFFRALFAEAPDAIARTAFATYRGAAGFEEAFIQTGARNVGCAVNPVRADQSCDCGWKGTYEARPSDALLAAQRRESKRLRAEARMRRDAERARAAGAPALPDAQRSAVSVALAVGPGFLR